MNQLQVLLEEFNAKIFDLNSRINTFLTNFPNLNLDDDILEQTSLEIVEFLELLMPQLNIDEDKQEAIKESINYYKLNLDNEIDLKMLLIRDLKCEQFIKNITYLYKQSLIYKEQFLANLKYEKNNLENIKIRISKIIENINSQEVVNLENLTELLKEISVNDEIIINIVKHVLQNNLNIYQKKEISIPEKDDNNKNIVENISDTRESSKEIPDEGDDLNQLVESSNQEDIITKEEIAKNKKLYATKLISNEKDEELKCNIQSLITKIEDLKDDISARLQTETKLYMLLGELNTLLLQTQELNLDFLTNYIVYKELINEEDELIELVEEYTNLTNKYEALNAEFERLEAIFNNTKKHDSKDLVKLDSFEFDLDLNNWNFCRYLIFTNTTHKDFFKEFSKKNLGMSTILTLLEAFKTLVTTKDISTIGGTKLYDVDKDLREYRVINSNDGGAIRIYYIQQEDGSLFIPKILFKVSDKQNQEEKNKMKKMDFKLLANNYSSKKEEMTKDLIGFIIERFKTLKAKQQNTKIENNEIEKEGGEFDANGGRGNK